MKRIISLCLLLCLLLTLCGCNTQPKVSSIARPDEKQTLPEDETGTTPAGQTPTTPSHQHSYKEATCEEPKACVDCGHIIAEATGHSYAPASCTAPKTCERCGVTEGEALGHLYVGATCDRNGWCMRCNVQQQAPGHRYNNAGFCSACGASNPNKPTVETKQEDSDKEDWHISLNPSERFYYSSLKKDQQLAYLRLYIATHTLEPTVYLGRGWTEETASAFFKGYLNDNPDQFYLDNSMFGLTVNTDGSGDAYLHLRYTDGTTFNEIEQALPEQTRKNIQKRAAVFQDEVYEILNTIPADLPAAKKEKRIYDYLLKNCNFDLDAANSADETHSSRTAYGPLVNKTGTSEGFAAAFQTLCFAVGINNVSLRGTVDQHNQTWCAVQLDKEWYACDPGMDVMASRQSTPSYRHFNITSQQMNGDHTPDQDSKLVCTGTKYSYDKYFKS